MKMAFFRGDDGTAERWEASMRSRGRGDLGRWGSTMDRGAVFTTRERGAVGMRDRGAVGTFDVVQE